MVRNIISNSRGGDNRSSRIHGAEKKTVTVVEQNKAKQRFKNFWGRFFISPTLFLFFKKKTKPLQGLRGHVAELHSAKRKNYENIFSQGFYRIKLFRKKFIKKRVVSLIKLSFERKFVGKAFFFKERFFIIKV